MTQPAEDPFTNGVLVASGVWLVLLCIVMAVTVTVLNCVWSNYVVNENARLTEKICELKGATANQTAWYRELLERVPRKTAEKP